MQQASARDAYLSETVQKLLSVMEYDVPYTAAQLMDMLGPVSYTHLDVYKRQLSGSVFS